ncbi:integrin alpha [Mariniblastus sp.]|nr:integrin alpha [Mariniblastus sp.]
MPFFFLTSTESSKAQTITHVPLYTFHSDSAVDYFGFSVSGAGDVNGDGKADLIVGAWRDGDDRNGVDSGSARVFSGDDGSVLYLFDGDDPLNWLGHSVSGAGDVNGDGNADLIVGFRGGGLGVRVLSGSDGSILYDYDGGSENNQFGESVSDAGDVNGDGTPDLIVGDISGNNGTGSAHVLSGIDGSVLYDFDGDNDRDWFGSSVSGAGDVNGDGTPDLIVGARFANNDDGRSSGKARVFSGIDGSVLYSIDGDDPGDGLGISVSSAGDINGDGKADLIIGAHTDDNNGTWSGSVRVLSGSDGGVLYNFNGDGEGDHFGHSVSCAGDVNGDGTPDLIVGAYRDDNNADDSGSARVLSGSDGRVLYNFDGDNAEDWFGYSVSGAGDVNGDGVDDFIVGARNGGANDGGYARVFVSQISEPELSLGDVSRDGFIDFSDISPFIILLAAGDYQIEADINEDQIVDFSDIGPFIVLLTL